MKVIKKLSAVTKIVTYPRKLILELADIVNNRQQTYFPELQQKSRWTIFREQLFWIIRNKEINRYYYVYGLDRKNEKKSPEIIGYKHFKKLRDTNLHPPGINFNYACLLRDKFVFGQFIKSLNFPTPKNIALIDKKGITWLDNMQVQPLESLSQYNRGDVDGFCKKLSGLKGEGAFPLRFTGNKMFIGDNEITVEQLAKKIDGQYLLQQRLTQHPDMARMHPYSINTLRLLTFNNNGKIELFSAAFRVGTHKNSVDNWGAGGLAIGVDITTGKLRADGFLKPGGGGRLLSHPDSGITFLNYQIPFFEESAELVKKVHRYLYGIHSIGWDVAIMDNGPILIEANEGWDGSFAMCTDDHFKSRFLQMYNKENK